MTNPDLAALSEAATQGPWKKGAKRNCDIDIIGKPTWPCTRYGKKGEWDVAVVTELENVKEQQANAALIVALVNEYRAGRLVQIDEGIRERVKAALLKEEKANWNVTLGLDEDVSSLTDAAIAPDLIAGDADLIDGGK